MYEDISLNTVLFALFKVWEKQSVSTSISGLSLPNLTGLSCSQQASRGVCSSLSAGIGCSQ